MTIPSTATITEIARTITTTTDTIHYLNNPSTRTHTKSTRVNISSNTTPTSATPNLTCLSETSLIQAEPTPLPHYYHVPPAITYNSFTNNLIIITLQQHYHQHHNHRKIITSNHLCSAQPYVALLLLFKKFSCPLTLS